MRALGKGSVASVVKAALDVVRIALWLAAIVLAIAALGYLALLALTAAGAIEPAVVGDLESNIRFSPGVEYPAAGGRLVMLWAIAVGAIAISGGIIIVGRLRKLFEGFSSGEPFRKEYADHLRAIWITMLVVEVARYASSALLAVLLFTMHPAGSEPHYNFHIDLSTWLSIFVLIVIAEVFREGARMREEQELTI